ncbi:zinc knuckle CX2CX4HX4C containing protein [Tanacetum coccineum]
MNKDVNDGMNGTVDYAGESKILNRHGDVRDEIEIDDQNEERDTGKVIKGECKEDLEGVREESQGIKVNNDTMSTSMEKHVESVPGNKVGEDRNNKGCDDNGRLDEVNLATQNEEISYVSKPTTNLPNDNSEKEVKKSYAAATFKAEHLIDNKLKTIQTEVDENGNEFVIFDDEMIKEGSKKWQLTLCGYFVGCKMHINELRYNIRRMWSRHGFKDVTKNDCGMFFFKFHHEKGMNFVVDNGPWMVNNKPLVIQKWDVNMCVDKIEPDVIGKPLIMDAVTASICKLGVGRLGFARVLVEVQAKKGIPDKIDVVYKNAEKVLTGVKTIQNDKKLNVDVDKVHKHDGGTNDFVEVTYKNNAQKKVNQIVKPFQNNNVAGRLYTKTVYKPVNDKNGKRIVKVNDNLNMGTININGSSSLEKKEDSSTKEKTVKPIDTCGSKSGSKSSVGSRNTSLHIFKHESKTRKEKD